jgi:hypothetical protein
VPKVSFNLNHPISNLEHIKKMIGRTGEETQQRGVIDSDNYVHNTENASTDTQTRAG